MIILTVDINNLQLCDNPQIAWLFSNIDVYWSKWRYWEIPGVVYLQLPKLQHASEPWNMNKK